MRNLKIMGLALLAITAMSALGAQAASALNYHAFEKGTTTKYTGTVNLHGTSTGEHIFTAGATVKCKTATGKATFAGSTVTTITTSEITYGECTVAGQAATVEMNGCSYTFGEPTGSAPTYSIKNINLTCPSGKEIVVTAKTAGCTIKVGGPQEFKETTTTAENFAEGGQKRVKVVGKISKKIKYTGSGGICGGSGTEGSYEGTFDVRAFKNAAFTEELDAEIF